MDNRNPREYLEIICDPNKVYAVLTPSSLSSAIPKRYTCPYDGCGKHFMRAANLKVHERTHLGLRPFKCKFFNCNFSSERRENCINHIR